MKKLIVKEANNGEPCWKVRIYIRRCGMMHLLTRTEPSIRHENGVIKPVCFDLIQGTEEGDNLGYLDWSEVGAISWRFCKSVEKEVRKEA